MRDQSEVDGDAFLDAYDGWKRGTARGLQLDGGAGLEYVRISDLREAISAVRTFLPTLMLPDSAARFETPGLPQPVPHAGLGPRPGSQLAGCAPRFRD